MENFLYHRNYLFFFCCFLGLYIFKEKRRIFTTLCAAREGPAKKRWDRKKGSGFWRAVTGHCRRSPPRPSRCTILPLTGCCRWPRRENKPPKNKYKKQKKIQEGKNEREAHI
jgi:hypothetical protein